MLVGELWTDVQADGGEEAITAIDFEGNLNIEMAFDETLQWVAGGQCLKGGDALSCLDVLRANAAKELNLLEKSKRAKKPRRTASASAVEVEAEAKEVLAPCITTAWHFNYFFYFLVGD